MDGTIFSNKSSTLAFLQSKVKESIVLPQISFSITQYRYDINLKNRIRDFCEKQKCIVRSSSSLEDSMESSKAGLYLSVPNVTSANVDESIEKVINSYDLGDGINENEIIFIQPMLENPQICGVAFTMDPNNNGNYYVINYDESGSTDSVTSGEGHELKTYYLFKRQSSNNSLMQPIIKCLKELETIYKSIPLDVEFAVKDHKVYIFQVRPLVGITVNDSTSDLNLLKICFLKIESILGPKPNLCGKRTILSVMTDWNPAEMIGIHPKQLALSLYKRLITDREWAYQRYDYGYRDLRSHPLMIDLHGFPYIDTRISFNSFIPGQLPESIATKLVDYYIESLKNNPEKHDKVEFEIVFSCYTFDLPDRLNILSENGFSNEEINTIKSSLLKLTNDIIGIKDGMWVKDLQKIKILESKHDSVMSSDMEPISKIYWLLEDCGRYGTLPFAGLARAGFVAVQLLKSLVNVGILDDHNYQTYMNNLNTISSQLSIDYQKMDKNAFMNKYGHLRPGTYDITMERYDSNPDKYFSANESIITKQNELFSLTLEQYNAIEKALIDHGFEISVLQLFDFIKHGIEGREYSKFVFTKNVSDVLELLTQLGQQYGYNREDLQYLDISVINQLYCSAYDVKSIISDSIEKGKKAYEETRHLSLPPVIQDSIDVYEFFIPSSVPNYITLKNVTGSLIKGNLTGDNISGNIVLIEAADPGYDWIFSYPIAGFITKYGGVNSHMAIRAGELGIPAIIGVGEQLYSVLKMAQVVSIDCLNHRLEVIH